jgi:hypothetical protein
MNLQPVGDFLNADNIGNERMGQLLEEEAAHDAAQRGDTFMEIELDPAMLMIAGLSEPATNAVQN